MSNHVILAAGRELATALQTGIGVDDDHRRDSGGDGVASTPTVTTTHVRQRRLVKANARYLHGVTTMFPVCALAMNAVCASRNCSSG